MHFPLVTINTDDFSIFWVGYDLRFYCMALLLTAVVGFLFFLVFLSPVLLHPLPRLQF